MNLAEDLFRRIAEVPDRPALTFAGRSWTYAALADAVAAQAAALDAAGLTSGERVALVLRNRPESVVALYACWVRGAVPVLVSPLSGPLDLASALDRTAPRLALVSADLDAGFAAAAQAGLPAIAVADLPAAPAAYEPVVPLPLAPEHPASILFTGGTTGQPKAVVATHGGTQATLAKLAAASKGRPGPFPPAPPAVPPNLVLLPLFHSGGQQALLFSIHVGRAVALVERFSVAAVAEAAPRLAVDNLFLLPTMLYDLAYAAVPVDLASVRSVLVAGGAVDAETRAAFERRYGIPLLSNYGSTEIGHVAGWTAHDVREGRWRAGAAGRVYPGVEIEIRDEAGRALPDGSIGEICVRTGLTTGYVGSDDAPIHENGWVRSGDLGHLDADGVLFLAGRKRELIKCGGFQIFPTEIEDLLRTHPGVADVAVVGAPDPRLGEVPKAIIVPRARPDGQPPVADEIIAHVRDRLAHYKAVRRVEFVTELPRTAAGKIDRAALASRDPAHR